MKEYNEQVVETLDDAGCIIANKNIIIDNLQARIAELEAENERLRADNIAFARNLKGKSATTGATYEHICTQLAAAQEEIERLKFVHQVAMQLWQVAKGRCDGLEEKLAKAEQRVAEWQPISTAPKDGMRILIKGDCTVVAGWQFIHSADCYGWAIVNDVWMPERIATHWMPLPKAPNGASS